MKANPDNLTQKQQDGIIALLNEHSIGKAAEAVGVCERTVYRWLDDPKFIKAYRKARRDAYGQAVGLLQRYATLAANTLAKVMTDPKSTASSKVAAATSLLRFGREGIELEDLAARVEALEALEETGPMGLVG